MVMPAEEEDVAEKGIRKCGAEADIMILNGWVRRTHSEGD
jgi:hypothetical protein